MEYDKYEESHKRNVGASSSKREVEGQLVVDYDVADYDVD